LCGNRLGYDDTKNVYLAGDHRIQG
jgi:hypothetical protein